MCSFRKPLDPISRFTSWKRMSFHRAKWTYPSPRTGPPTPTVQYTSIYKMSESCQTHFWNVPLCRHGHGLCCSPPCYHGLGVLQGPRPGTHHKFSNNEWVKPLNNKDLKGALFCTLRGRPWCRNSGLQLSESLLQLWIAMNPFPTPCSPTPNRSLTLCFVSAVTQNKIRKCHWKMSEVEALEASHRSSASRAHPWEE